MHMLGEPSSISLRVCWQKADFMFWVNLGEYWTTRHLFKLFFQSYTIVRVTKKDPSVPRYVRVTYSISHHWRQLFIKYCDLKYICYKVTFRAFLYVLLLSNIMGKLTEVGPLQESCKDGVLSVWTLIGGYRVFSNTLFLWFIGEVLVNLILLSTKMQV